MARASASVMFWLMAVALTSLSVACRQPAFCSGCMSVTPRDSHSTPVILFHSLSHSRQLFLLPLMVRSWSMCHSVLMAHFDYLCLSVCLVHSDRLFPYSAMVH